MSITTYNSASMGTIQIKTMVTEHIQNAVKLLRETGEQPESLATMEAELATRQTETKEAASA